MNVHKHSQDFRGGDALHFASKADDLISHRSHYTNYSPQLATHTLSRPNLTSRSPEGGALTTYPVIYSHNFFSIFAPGVHLHSLHPVRPLATPMWMCAAVVQQWNRPRF